MSASAILGPLENEVMEVMWKRGRATVRQIVDSLKLRRQLAYTTIMTVMNILVAKGLLNRAPNGKAYVYTVAMTPEVFLCQKSREAVNDVLAQFGDLAIAQFVEAITRVRPEYLEHLRGLGAIKPDQSEKEQ